MTKLELPEHVRRWIYYVSLLVGLAIEICSGWLGALAQDTSWFRALDGANEYLLVLVAGVAASHLPGKALDARTGQEEPLDQVPAGATAQHDQAAAAEPALAEGEYALGDVA